MSMSIMVRLCRVYYDRSLLHPWTLDLGPNTMQFNATQVNIVGGSGALEIAKESVREGEPKAWLALCDVTIMFSPMQAAITIKQI